MKVYRNTVTGAEIRTECELTGEHWQEVSAGAPAAESKPPKATTTKAVKKNGSNG